MPFLKDVLAEKYGCSYEEVVSDISTILSNVKDLDEGLLFISSPRLYRLHTFDYEINFYEPSIYCYETKNFLILLLVGIQN